jgi:hypothetical protein
MKDSLFIRKADLERMSLGLRRSIDGYRVQVALRLFAINVKSESR